MTERDFDTLYVQQLRDDRRREHYYENMYLGAYAWPFVSDEGKLKISEFAEKHNFDLQTIGLLHLAAEIYIMELAEVELVVIGKVRQVYKIPRERRQND